VNKDFHTPVFTNSISQIHKVTYSQQISHANDYLVHRRWHSRAMFNVYRLPALIS